MRKVRASELGSFNYCQRAWWYQQQNMPSENQGAMDAGSREHREHNRGVKLAVFYRWLALAVLVIAIVLALWILR
jgi:CRISPR/Cas system-associated exonuclease Cas4 (RecB family)